MAINATKLVELAARDIPQTKIAKALGVSDSAVAQALQNPKIVAALAERRAELATLELDTITTIENINERLLNRAEELVDTSDSLSEVIRAYETMSRMQSIQRASSSADAQAKLVAQQLPQFIVNNLNIQLNQRNEIVSIDERAMVTMPTRRVQGLIDAKLKAKKAAADSESEVDF